MIETSLATIEQSAKAYSEKRDTLSSIVTLLNQQIEALKQAALPDLRRAVAKAAEKQADLTALVDGARHLFIKPKTLIFHGIKVGLRKGSGGIDWQDDAALVARIKKLFPTEEAELLIKTTEKPIAKALANLDVAELKKLGCTVEATGDVVVISPVDSHVDKLVTALLKDAVEEATAATN